MVGSKWPGKVWIAGGASRTLPAVHVQGAGGAEAISRPAGSLGLRDDDHYPGRRARKDVRYGVERWNDRRPRYIPLGDPPGVARGSAVRMALLFRPHPVGRAVGRGSRQLPAVLALHGARRP